MIARIWKIDEEEELKVMCGNEKLMNRFDVKMDFNQLPENIDSLEQEGKTVVCLAVDQVPRLLISLKEQHTTKEDALDVIKTLRNDMGIKVAMCTGDNQYAALMVADYLGIDS